MFKDNSLSPLLDNSYVIGFADLQGLLPNKYNQFKWGISIGKRLNNTI